MPNDEHVRKTLDLVLTQVQELERQAGEEGGREPRSAGRIHRTQEDGQGSLSGACRTQQIGGFDDSDWRSHAGSGNAAGS